MQCSLLIILCTCILLNLHDEVFGACRYVVFSGIHSYGIFSVYSQQGGKKQKSFSVFCGGKMLLLYIYLKRIHKDRRALESGESLIESLAERSNKWNMHAVEQCTEPSAARWPAAVTDRLLIQWPTAGDAPLLSCENPHHSVPCRTPPRLTPNVSFPLTFPSFPPLLILSPVMLTVKW